MREHQIVITLKPEQFQEVQRLSRAAGAKSMGIFVRQQLLAALGIEGAAAPVSGQSRGLDLQRLSAELRRLHGELKAFVAESLPSDYVPDAAAPARVPETASEPAVPAAHDGESEAEDAYEESAGGVTLAPVSEFDSSEETLEQLARRAFAISPKMGALEASVDEEQPAQLDVRRSDRDPLEDLLEDPARQSRLNAAARNALPASGSRDDSGDIVDEAEPDETVDVPVNFSEKSSAVTSERERAARFKQELPPPAAPPPPPSGPSAGGGPPPRRRRS